MLAWELCSHTEAGSWDQAARRLQPAGSPAGRAMWGQPSRTGDGCSWRDEPAVGLPIASGPGVRSLLWTGRHYGHEPHPEPGLGQCTQHRGSLPRGLSLCASGHLVQPHLQGPVFPEPWSPPARLWGSPSKPHRRLNICLPLYSVTTNSVPLRAAVGQCPGQQALGLWLLPCSDPRSSPSPPAQEDRGLDCLLTGTRGSHGARAGQALRRRVARAVGLPVTTSCLSLPSAQRSLQGWHCGAALLGTPRDPHCPESKPTPSAPMAGPCRPPRCWALWEAAGRPGRPSAWGSGAESAGTTGVLSTRLMSREGEGVRSWPGWGSPSAFTRPAKAEVDSGRECGGCPRPSPTALPQAQGIGGTSASVTQGGEVRAGVTAGQISQTAGTTCWERQGVSSCTVGGARDPGRPRGSKGLDLMRK